MVSGSADEHAGTATGDPIEVKRKSTVFLIYVLVSLYAVCYQLQAPLEPFLVERLVGKGNTDEAALSYGHLQSFFMVVQTVGSLAFGYLLDFAGVRLGFMINFLCCALQYAVLANTDSLGMLYLSKIPGVGMAGFLCAQTAVSHVTSPGPERIESLGRLATAYTIGGIIGPYTGGLLGSKGDYFLSAKLATVGSILAMGMSSLLPSTGREPESASAPSLRTRGKPAKTKQPPSHWMVRAGAVLRVAGALLFVKLASGVANSIASSTQSLVLKTQLKFSEADLGFFMSAQFAFGGFANAFLLGPLTAFLGGHAHLVVGKCLSIMSFGYIAQSLVATMQGYVLPSMFAVRQCSFVAIAMMLSMFQYSLGTSITAESTQLVSEDMKGTLIGLEHGLFSAARIFTPSIGVLILNSAGVSSLYAACAAVFLAVLVFWRLFASRLLPHEADGTKRAD